MNRKEHGITLVALILTVIILIILATSVTSISLNHFHYIRTREFYTKLEVAQEAIIKIQNTNESYKDTGGNTVYLKGLGATPTTEQNQVIATVNSQLGTSYDASKFLYYTKNQVEKDLGISGVEMNLLIDFEDGVVISPEGAQIDGQMYYALPADSKNRVSENSTKNTGAVNFTYAVTKYSSNQYKVTVTPTTVGDITKGIVQYKQASLDFWTVAENNEFVIKRLGQYDIKYTDANQNTITKRIQISLDGTNPVATEVQ